MLTDPLAAIPAALLADPSSLRRIVGVLAVLTLAALIGLFLSRRALARSLNAVGALAADRADRDRQIAALRPEAERGAALAVETATLRTRLEERDRVAAALAEDRDGLTDALHRARQDGAALDRALAEARLAAHKDREAAAREIATLTALRAEMSRDFQLLSAETLRQQGEGLQKQQEGALSALLTPFRDQVQRFQTELAERNRILDTEGARLREQIEGLQARSIALGAEAEALSTALKGGKQAQGAWGEMILERILEDSGLTAGTHYIRQTQFRDADGGRWRPDVVVRMPRGKVLVIDSKVSLNAYERAMNSDDPPVRAAALRQHVAALRAHVETLAGKGYERIDDASVDYVLMFIPIEGAFSEAMKVDPEIARLALEQRIGIATPTTLMLALRTVEHVWQVEKRERGAAEIASRAGSLYDKVAGFVDAMAEVGRALDGAARAHGTALDRLSRGPGNVLRQVEMLRELGARTQKRLALSGETDPADDPALLEDARVRDAAQGLRLPGGEDF